MIDQGGKEGAAMPAPRRFQRQTEQLHHPARRAQAMKDRKAARRARLPDHHIRGGTLDPGQKLRRIGITDEGRIVCPRGQAADEANVLHRRLAQHQTPTISAKALR